MRCFACDHDLPDSSPKDRPTGRWYCHLCFEPTIEIQLAHASKEINWSRLADSAASTVVGSPFDVSEVLEAQGWETLKEMVASRFEFLEEDEANLETT